MVAFRQTWQPPEITARKQLREYRMLALRRGVYIRCLHDMLRWSKISCLVCFVIGMAVGGCVMAAIWSLPL